MYIVFINEDITPNPPFQFSGPLLVILSVSSNVYFGDTRPVSLIGSYCICSDNINECVLTIEINELLETHEHTIGKS